MPYSVIYQEEVRYRPLPGYTFTVPALPVSLFHPNGSSVEAIGILDTGSTHTVFQNQFAALLGITDITAGDIDTISTAGGGIQIYLFDMEVELSIGSFHQRISGRVGFSQGHLPRNILGLNPVFNQVRIGFRDSQQRFYLLNDSY